MSTLSDAHSALLIMLHSIQEIHVKMDCLTLPACAEFWSVLTSENNLEALSHLACNIVSVHNCTLVCMASRNLSDDHRALSEILPECLVG